MGRPSIDPELMFRMLHHRIEGWSGLLEALKVALDKAGAAHEIIAPKVTGVKASDGSWIEADQMIGGGPSAL